MNKIMIPSIFVAVLLVAALFASMPVEKAQTVHTTIQTNLRDNTVVSLVGYTLATQERIILLDLRGTNKLVDAEITARTVSVLGTGATDLRLETLTAGATSWTAVTVAAFPVSDATEAVIPRHADVTDVVAISIFNDTAGTVTFASKDYVGITVHSAL